MKKLFALLLSFTIVTVGLAQGNGNGKGNKKWKDKSTKHEKIHDRHEDDNSGILGRRDDDDRRRNSDYNRGQGKSAKNQPAKVRAAFQRDYPNATNVSWTKNQGSWTATFNNGRIFNSRTSATYHSNGERRGRDAYGTTQNRRQQGTVIDRVLNRRTVN